MGYLRNFIVWLLKNLGLGPMSGLYGSGSYGSYGSVYCGRTAAPIAAPPATEGGNIERPSDLDRELVVARYTEDPRWAEGV